MKIDYGKKGLELSLNPMWNVRVLQPEVQEPYINPVEKIRNAINNPIGCKSLKKIIQKKHNLNRICIVVSDSTRPVPSHFIVEALIKELNDLGIQDHQILVLVATGLHRPARKNELEKILRKSLIERLEIISHIATDSRSLHFIGKTSDQIPIYINEFYYESDLRIITGYVEPHFFFGFSGGRKTIVPGISGSETIQKNHSAKYIASEFSRFGVYKENLLHKNSVEATKLVGVDFAINICINKNHEIVKVIAGNFENVHEELVKYQLKHIFKKIEEPYDIVLCGNGGYPLDLNLYQAVKSMAIGEMAVKKGGTIISVNECAEGIGIGQEQFRKLLYSGMKPEILYNKILKGEIVTPDQWEIQILARILMKADIIVVSSLKENEIGNIGLKYAENVEEAIKKALMKEGQNAKILILPNGPQILPTLK